VAGHISFLEGILLDESLKELIPHIRDDPITKLKNIINLSKTLLKKGSP
jgi:hypothetical protein